jgi:hypothetical protein
MKPRKDFMEDVIARQKGTKSALHTNSLCLFARQLHPPLNPGAVSLIS